METLISPSAASPFRSASSDEVVRLGSGEGSFSSTAVPEGGVGMAWAASEEMASNRASIRLLIAFYAAEDRLVTTLPSTRVVNPDAIGLGKRDTNFLVAEILVDRSL